MRPHPQRDDGLAGAQPHPGRPGGPRLRDVRGHVGPHEPFDAPPFDVARYADPRYTGERVIYPQYGRPDYLSPEEHDHVRALYAPWSPWPTAGWGTSWTSWR